MDKWEKVRQIGDIFVKRIMLQADLNSLSDQHTMFLSEMVVGEVFCLCEQLIKIN